MMKNTQNIIQNIALVLIVTFCIVTNAQDRLPTQKRAIHAGWDMPTTAYLQKNWKEIDQMRQFDGVIFSVESVDDNGKRVSFLSPFTPDKWKEEWFAQAKKDLEECQFKNVTHNFLMFYGTPGTVKWNDDEGWKNVCEKIAMAAKIAKQGRAIGLCLDLESYVEPLFQYQPEQGLSWDETKKLARQRGQEFFSALSKEFPDAVVLTYWFNSLNAHAGTCDNPDLILQFERYGLMPYFYDGALDVIPPTMTIVDGAELYFLEGDQFEDAAKRIRQWNGPCARLVSPENRAKYRAQVQVGFGFYLDMYVNDEKSVYYRGPLENGTRLDRLERNLKAALTAADEYVWVYGEKCRWFGSKSCNEFENKPRENFQPFGLSWESQLPGVTEVIARSKDLQSAAIWKVEQMEKAGTLKNLVENGYFTERGCDGWPAKCSFWNLENHPSGKIAFDPDVTYPGSPGGSCKVTKVYTGCLIPHVKVEPSQTYLVRAKVKSVNGSPRLSLRVRWQDGKGKWIHESGDVLATFYPLKDESGWLGASVAVTIPSDTYEMLPLVNVGFQSDDSTVWIDDVEVFRLDD